MATDAMSRVAVGEIGTTTIVGVTAAAGEEDKDNIPVTIMNAARIGDAWR